MPNKSALKISTILALAGILIVTFISYLPALKGEFLLWDDDVHVLDNITIRGLDAEHIQDMFTTTVNKIYIPLTSLSFAVEHHFFGYDPFIYHLNNLLLHLLVVALVFLLGRNLGLSRAAAAIAALVFGVHPIHVESVAWITERKDVLYAVFYMAALLSYVSCLDSLKIDAPSGKKVQKKAQGACGFLVCATVLGVLSMLAKPMALSLPLIFLLLDWFKGREFRPQTFIEKLPLVILVTGIGWITYSTHARVPGESIVQSALIWPWTFTFYLRQFFFPLFSIPLFRLPKPVALENPEYWLSAVVLALVILAVIRLRRDKWFVFAALFYFLSIFFLLRFDETKDVNTVADRFMYLPGLGICLLAGLSVQWLWTRLQKTGRAAVAIVVIFSISALSLRTFQQSQIWQDSLVLWRHQLKYAPNEPFALNNFAIVIGKTKEFQDAQKRYKARRTTAENIDPRQAGKVDYLISLYQRAVEARPEYVDAYYNLGDQYARVGKFAQAVESYKKALALDPKFKDPYCGLGDLYIEAGDSRQAISAYEQAMRLHPEDQDLPVHVIKAYTKALRNNPGDSSYVDARKNALALFAAMVHKDRPRAISYFNLGNMYVESGDGAMALLAYRRALELNPRHAATLYNLGNFYKDQGRLKDALAFYQKAIKINPRLSDAYLNMGIVYARLQDRALEKECYQKAVAANARNGRAYFNLAFLEETSGNMEGAADLYQKAVFFDPDNAEGYYNLGNLYAKLNQPRQAMSAYLDAVVNDVRHVDARVNLSILSFQQGHFADAVKYCDDAVALGYEVPQGYLNALAPHRNPAIPEEASVDSVPK